MIDYLIFLPAWAGIALSILLSTACGLAVYLLSRRLISRYPTAELKDPIGSLFRVVGMLVSLMLSLAFAEVVVAFRGVENAIDREAVALARTHHSSS